MQKKKSNNYSFTLLELLITIAALTIVLAITLPSYSFFDRYALRQEIKMLFTTLSYLQQRAIASNQDYQLSFDAHHNRYNYPGPTNKTITKQLASSITFDFISGSLGPPSKPTHRIKSPITFPGQKVTFFANGTISSGTAYLTTKNHDAMMAVTVPISQVSFIRMYGYDQGKWRKDRL